MQSSYTLNSGCLLEVGGNWIPATNYRYEGNK
jgi:hypothetical protein